MAEAFDPVWAADGEVDVPTEAEQRIGFQCGPVTPGRFNWLFQTMQSLINSLNIGEMVNQTRVIGTTEGLKGGGDLTADRTLSLDVPGLEAETGIANDDLIAIFDTSAGVHRKMTRDNFVAGLGGGGGGSITGGENVGTGTGLIFKGLSGANMQFRKLLNAGGLTIGVATDDVTISLADMGSALTFD